jgi:tRNA:m4X modification enzyme
VNSTVAVEDLNLNAVESLRGVPYLAIGKHLCGPATGNSTTFAVSIQP